MTQTTEQKAPMTLRRYTPAELQTVLADHKKWLAGDEGSVANLAAANLAGEDLYMADLTKADLTKADLSGTILAKANLAGTTLAKADLAGATLTVANLTGAILAGADLAGANLTGAILTGAILTGANLAGANLAGAILAGARYGDQRLAAVVVMTGLYKYQCWAAITTDGVPYVRMGCLFHSVEEWDAIGIRKSNVSEFPDDGSAESEERAAAFEITRAKALRMAEAHRKELS
jgi:hypothetical protein